MIRLSLYAGFDAKRNEKTPIRTTNIVNGLSSAQTNPPMVPWYRALKSVRTSVQINPARRTAGRVAAAGSSVSASTGTARDPRSVPVDALVIAWRPRR
jgi:hypothetical protein